MNWVRVTPKNKCPICQHGDWCCIGQKWVNCMRSTSARACDNGGWLHPLNGVSVPVIRHEPAPRVTIDACAMMKRWFAQTPRPQYDALASALGVAATALLALKCGWAPEHRAWAFPMRNGAGEVVGIRLRAESGRKWSVTGGHEGIFVPNLPADKTVWLAEGPTDCAALLTLGKFAIGRPSCSGGIAHTAATLARFGVKRAVIIADNDDDKTMANGKRWNPGVDGAQRLADEIGVLCCVVILPVKDAREFCQLGGTAELLDSLTHSLVWTQPNKAHFTHATNMPVPI